jgi:hypothetical protein
MGVLIKIWAITKSTGFMAALALISFGFAIYQTFYFEKKPEITISINALSRVFDIHQSVGKLKVIYANEDLRVSKKQLWAMTVTVSNTGNAGIRKDDFDEAAPFGLYFTGAEIVDTPSIHTSNSYLDESIKIKTQRDRIIFSPSIIESKDSLQISVLLLGPQSSTPTIDGFGKISGVSKFVVSTEGVAGNKTTWEKIIGTDSYVIHLYRVFVYFGVGLIVLLGLLLLMVVIMMPFFVLDELQGKKRKAVRKNQISNFMSSSSMQGVSEEVWHELKALSNLYIEYNEHALVVLKLHISEANERRDSVEKHDDVEDIHSILMFDSIDIGRRHFVEKFEELGLISFDDGTPKYSSTLEGSIEKLARFLGADMESLTKEELAHRDEMAAHRKARSGARIKLGGAR